MVSFKSNRARRSRFACLGLAVGLSASLTLGSPAMAETRVSIGQTFIAGSLDPIEGSAGWALVSHGIAEQLFRVDRDGQIVPNLAAGATRLDATTWSVEIAPGRQFSDGAPVDAAAVAAALNRSGENNPAARASAGRLTFEALSEMELRVTTEKPTPVLPSILAEWPQPVYRVNTDGLVFTGPFLVEAFEPGARLDLAPNPHYDNAQKRPSIVLRRIADGQSLALAMRAGELDLAFNLPVEALGMVQADPTLSVKSFPVAYQYMMWMNTRNEALSDTRVRQALDLAIDREALILAARAGEVATGAFARTFPFAAEAGTTRDVARAERLLDEAGWVRGADGHRAKNGVALSFDLVAYPQRPDLVTYQPVIRAALEDIGIGVTTRLSEAATDTARSGDYDLLLWAQHTAPAGDPAFFLSLFLGSEGANNYTGWRNADFDALIARLGEEEDPSARAALAREAQALVASEVPVSFLVTPEWHVGLSERLAAYEPWGSDYYVIRPDLMIAY
jgi:peptide/nickel transport system substrate-binding protein